MKKSSLTFALWGAVLGCCVWGVHVTHAAAGLNDIKAFIESEEKFGAGTHSTDSISPAYLGYFTHFLLNNQQLPERIHFGPIAHHTDQLILASAKHSWWSVSAVITAPVFTDTCNRWSCGFH